MSTRAPEGQNGPRRRRGLGWLAALIAVLVIAGVAIAVVASRDDDSTSGGVDSSIDAVTNGGDDALDTVTDGGAEAGNAATEAGNAATEAGGDALESVTDGDGDAADPGDGATIVEDDPVVEKLARGRELPFVAGPWVRAAYRNAVYGRLRPATKEFATKVRQGDGYAIRFG